MLHQLYKKPQIIRFLIFIPLIISLWFVISYFSYTYWVHGTNHRDFYPRWAGVRYLLSGNRDVYSEDATRVLQITLYGTPLSSDQDQQGFAYPIQLAILLLPFAIIPNVEVSTALWQGFSIITLFFTLLLFNQQFSERSKWIVLIFLFWQFPILMIYQGQMTIIPFASLLISLVLFRRNRYFLSGLFLSFSIVKPQISLLPILIFVIVTIIERRFDFIKGFMLASIVLLLFSFFIAGWWIPSWLNALSRYASYAKVSWPVIEIYRINPLLFYILTIGLIMALIEFHNKPLHMVTISIAIGMLLIPQTLNWDLTMIIIPLIFSWKGRAKAGVIMIWIFGWLLLLLSGIPDWWKIQSICLPILTIALFIFAHSGKENISIRQD